MEQIRNRCADRLYLVSPGGTPGDMRHSPCAGNGWQQWHSLAQHAAKEHHYGAMVRSVYDALQRGADNQVSGVLGTLQGAVAQINTPEMMWVFSRPGCPLDVNNPDHPAILTVATNPTTSQTLSPLCSLVITVATKLMNQCLGKKKKMLFFGGMSALSFCYRDLSAWWETRPDQPDTQYHFVITG